MMHRLTAQAWDTWAAALASRKRGEALVKRALARWARTTLASAFDALADAVARRREVEARLGRVLARMRHALAAAAFAGWAEAAALLAAERAFANKVRPECP